MKQILLLLREFLSRANIKSQALPQFYIFALHILFDSSSARIVYLFHLHSVFVHNLRLLIHLIGKELSEDWM